MQAYADDFTLVIAAKGRQTIEENAVTALNALNQWSKEMKIRFSEEKTSLIYFPTAKRVTPPKIKFNNHTVRPTKQLKVLGVVIDEKFSWHPHINYLGTQMISSLIAIKAMSRRGWGLSGRVVKELYSRGLERRVAYGCGAWWSSPTAKLRLHANKVQRSALLLITKCYRTTSTAALQVLAGILPLDLRLDLENKIFAVRRSQEARLSTLAIDVDRLAPKKMLWTEHPASFFQNSWATRSPANKGLEIFTDGSKIDEKVGAGYAVYHNRRCIYKESLRLNDDASVFQAEVYAIEKAMSFIRGHRPVLLYSDSQAALKAICKVNTTLLAVDRAKYATKGVNLCWVKAHIGIDGNEQADQLAKAGASKESIDVDLGFTVTHAKHRLLKEAISIWQARWDYEEKGRTTFFLVPKVTLDNIWCNYILNQMITGHGNFPCYLQRFRLRDADNCRWCHTDTPADFQHYIICIGLSDVRKRCCPRLKQENLKQHFDVPEGRRAISRFLAIVTEQA